MHSAARGARDVFGIIVALAFLGCVLAVPTAAGAARDPEPAVAAADHAELLRLAEQAKAAFRRRMEPPPIQISVLDNFRARQDRDRSRLCPRQLRSSRRCSAGGSTNARAGARRQGGASTTGQYRQSRSCRSHLQGDAGAQGGGRRRRQARRGGGRASQRRAGRATGGPCAPDRAA